MDIEGANPKATPAEIEALPEETSRYCALIFQ